MPTKPGFYSLADFRKLSGSFRKPVVIHFSKTQLDNLRTSASTKSGKPPAKSLTLTVTGVDGIEGGFVTIACPEPPTKLGSGELRCGKAPGIPTGPTPDPPDLQFCFLRFHGNGRVTCQGRCRRGNCTLIRWRPVPGSNIEFYTCSC